jgi:MFS family permease
VTPQAIAVWLLALGQTLNYAALYYGFPALLPRLVAETGWTKAELAAGPTLAFLVMAALTPLTGRLVDRGWGGELLVICPLIGAAALAGMGAVTGQAGWLILWAVVGVAQAGSFYETCFAFVTRRLGDGARAAITRITLVAGFAGTLAFPLGAVLGQGLGGQGALAALAAMIVLGTVPANLWAVTALRRQERSDNLARPPAAPGALARALRRPAFWAIAAAFGLTYLNHAILITYALILFQDRGAGAGLAVLAAACIGPAQVAGRVVLLLNEARISTGRAVIWAFGGMVLAAGLLMLAGAAPLLIFGFALVQGAGIGVTSILRPVLVAEVLGRPGFGAISGAVAVAPILASAAGPSVGAALIEAGGAGAVYTACLGLAAAGLVIALGLLRGGRAG